MSLFEIVSNCLGLEAGILGISMPRGSHYTKKYVSIRRLKGVI